MGTNYYHRGNICGCCGRYDERHICKSMTSFEAIVVWQTSPPFEQVITIGSWAEWKNLLRQDGEIWDEYGKEWDVEEFIAKVDDTNPDHRATQYERMCQYCPSDVSTLPTPEKTWLDPDGFTFSARPFS